MIDQQPFSLVLTGRGAGNVVSCRLHDLMLYTSISRIHSLVEHQAWLQELLDILLKIKKVYKLNDNVHVVFKI